jgi:proline racemase
MRWNKTITVVDCHAEGESGQVVVGGIPLIPGDTVFDKRMHLQDHADDSRPTATCPCGSDTIATVTAQLESGQVPITGDETVVRLDTPAGLIEATATVDNGRVTGVTFVGALAFCLLPDQQMTLPTFGTVSVDIAYGGNFYAIVDADSLGIQLSPDAVGPATGAAAEIYSAVKRGICRPTPAACERPRGDARAAVPRARERCRCDPSNGDHAARTCRSVAMRHRNDRQGRHFVLER